MKKQKFSRHLKRARVAAGLVTGIFALVAALLAGLVFISVYTMTQAANDMDNSRAANATLGALSALKANMAGVLRDNATWDDAYNHINAFDAAEWASTNWGVTTENYPLYNVSAVIAPNNDEIIAYKDGVPFVASWYFDPSLKKALERTRASQSGILTEFIKTKSGVSVLGLARITPSTPGTTPAETTRILLFSKDISASVLQDISKNFDLPDLRLLEKEEKSVMQVAIDTGDDETISFLSWPAKKPGTIVVNRVRPLFLVASAILVLFLIGILLVGHSVIKNLTVSGERSQFRATHDALSGLLNRAGFLEAIGNDIAGINNSSTGITMFLLDLDGFKAVNDIWGHAVGDELISTVASHLKHVAPRGAHVARLGGDEFAIALPTAENETPLDQAILHVFEKPFMIRNLTIEVGVSIGTTQIVKSHVDTLEVMRQADVALYKAKESGRGRSVAYSPSFDAERAQQVEFEEKLRHAITNRTIDVHFQPLFNALNREITGVEALARWTLPTGRVTPDVFIPLAERAGLIDALGALVLARTLDAAQFWPRLQVSVNVSPLQLRNPTFADTVKGIIKAKHFDPERLVLEITESVLITFPEQAKRSINALQAIGVKFALDDFGCGYASLGALKEFRFDRMKIDRSLVLALGNTADGHDILNATVKLANALNVPVTAEGIETEEQARSVINSGCDVLQGYLLGKPMVAHDVTTILEGRPIRDVA